MIVDIFVPCFVDQFSPQTAFNMIKILKKLGVEVHYNDKQTCCGQMAFNDGHWDKARDLGEKFINDFSNDRYIVAPTASCVEMVRNNYDKMFYNSSLHIKYKKVQSNIFEFTDFVVNILKKESFGSVFNSKITYHDSCSAHKYGLADEPRTLLNNVEGIDLVEMKDSDECCGFGGVFSVKYEPISTAMAQQKVENALATGAEYIVSTDSSCLMHLQAYINKNKLNISTMHIIDVLAHF